MRNANTPEKIEATLSLRCNYDLWEGQIGKRPIQKIINDEKAACKAAVTKLELQLSPLLLLLQPMMSLTKSVDLQMALMTYDKVTQ